jgi:hypothetical protein
VVATGWAPLDHVEEIYLRAAPVLHPTATDPAFALGVELGHEMLSGVYRFVARVVSVSFLAEQTATLWSRYHDTGVASSEQTGPRSGVLLVRGHPTLPPTVRRTLSGS